MIPEDKLAAAQLAQIFGSELLRVQEGARTDSGSVPNIVNLDPRQFIAQEAVNNSFSAKAQEQKMMHMLQQQAEASHPLPEPIPFQEPSPSTSQTPQANQNQTLNAVTSLGDIHLEKIVSCLERIAVALEKNPLLLNEAENK